MTYSDETRRTAAPNAQGLPRGAIELRADLFLYEVRVRFFTSMSLVAGIFSFVSLHPTSIAGYPDYESSVCLHVVGGQRVPPAAIGAKVAQAVADHIAPFQSVGCQLRGWKVRMVWPPGSTIEAEDQPSGISGDAASQPLPGSIAAPWTVLVAGGDHRRYGKVWWPGVRIDATDPNTMTLQQDSAGQWSDLGKGFGKALSDGSTTWVVANPRKAPGLVWVPTFVRVDTALRTYRRHAGPRQHGPGNVVSAITFLEPAALPEEL